MNLRLAAALGATVLALAACSPAPPTPSTTISTVPPDPTPTATATPGPNPSVGPLAPIELTVAEGTDSGPAAGQSLNLPAGWTAEVWANVPGARLATWTPDGPPWFPTEAAAPSPCSRQRSRARPQQRRRC